MDNLHKDYDSIVYDEDIYGTIKQNIKKFRKAKGMTSADLAELTNLSHDFIRQIQSNSKKTYNFSVETFYKISVALGVTMDDLIKRNDE